MVGLVSVAGEAAEQFGIGHPLARGLAPPGQEPFQKSPHAPGHDHLRCVPKKCPRPAARFKLFV